MRTAEGRGRTLDEAVDAALIELGETRRNVDVRVVSENPNETVVEVSIIDPALAQAAGSMPQANGKAETVRSLLDGLLKHMGVRAQVQEVPAKGSVAATTLGFTGEFRADLLVKGAYTNTRLQRFIFGDTTDHLISHAELPLWLAH